MSRCRPRFTLHWPKSLVWRSAAVVVGITLLVGFLFIAITAMATQFRVQRESAQRLGELLDTIESTVSIACFTEDQTLAAEVAHGLLKNSGVQGVVIRVGGGDLVRHYRDDTPPKIQDDPLRQVRDVLSPFNREQKVGEIELDPDPEAIARQVREEVTSVVIMLGLQLAALLAVVVSVVLPYVTRPIRDMSEGLHHLNAPAGERLPIPNGHAETEIGQLAVGINALADSLVTALGEERSLREAREIGERKYHAIFDNVETGIFLVGRDGSLHSCNPAFTRLLGAGMGEDRSLFTLPWGDPDWVASLVAECIDSNQSYSDDLALEGGQGGRRWLNLVLSPLDADTAQGVLADVTARKEAEGQARRLALIDPATGIWNREGLEECLREQILASPTGETEGFTLMLVDLTGYGRVKSTFGLQDSDQILNEVVARLRACLKVADTVARLVGGEFALLLPGVGQKEAMAIALQVAGVLSSIFDIRGTPLQLGASIGVARYPEDGAGGPPLQYHAALALEEAKMSSTERIRFFYPALVDAAQGRRQLEADMRLAIVREQFELFYQPIVDLEARRLSGAEALIRWRHPERGLVPPDAFIPLAEESGFIREIGLWVVEAACRQLAEWQAAGIDCYLSVNVSGCQIPDGLPPATLQAALARHGIDPSRLVLEITEGVLMADMDQALAWLEAVRALGFSIYLDDFGTGYSSLSYLKRLPVDTVKVDRSFVRDMGNNSSDRALVEAIVAMARSLGLSVVAEGVETATQLSLLRQMGCRSIQGYFFSRPVPRQEFLAVRAKIDTLLAAETEIALAG